MEIYTGDFRSQVSPGPLGDLKFFPRTPHFIFDFFSRNLERPKRLSYKLRRSLDT